MKRILFFAICSIVFASSSAQSATKGLCKFDTVSLQFAGTATDQASCLLRFVKKKATGSVPQPIPDVILASAGKTSDITASQLESCLATANIDPMTVGGRPSDPVAGDVRYFVIHDTSAPELTGVTSFPSNINESSWSANNLPDGSWPSLIGRVHIIISRVGTSRTMTKFSEARSKPAVKLESTSQVSASRKKFIHVENIQPRIKPPGSWGHIAPEPGFSDKQLERLAWVYVAASVRAKRWLIPAFHFNIDSELFPGVDVHDDPQTFDLAAWGTKIASVRTACTTP
jgi:hypothetical protein